MKGSYIYIGQEANRKWKKARDMDLKTEITFKTRKVIKARQKLDKASRKLDEISQTVSNLEEELENLLSCLEE